MILRVGDSAAGFALELEIPKILRNSLEMVGVVDSNFSRVEWFVYVSVDLGLLDFNTALLLYEGRELRRGVVVLGQVVEVDNVLLTRR